MSIKIHFIKDSEIDSSTEKLIKIKVKEIIKKFKKKISIDKVNIVIKTSNKPLKELGGVGGYCPSGKYVELSLDMTVSKNILLKNISKSLVHELHHAVRRQAGIMIEKEIFLESIISEGLADYFVFELLGDKPIWIIKMDNHKEKLRELKKIINKIFRIKYYEDWYIKGSNKKNIKRWSGYAIGFKIVKNYIIKNNLTSKDLIKIPAKKIFKGKEIDTYI